MSLKIDKFTGEFGFLSNFHEAPVYYNGKRYASVEHAYQAHKSLDEGTHELIRKALRPGEAKKLGKAVQLRDDWETFKFKLMEDLVREKFRNPMLRLALIETGDAELIEGNTWNDTTWGVCRGVGRNELGKILMKVREEVKLELQQEEQMMKT